jgi:hypothetical protein
LTKGNHLLRWRGEFVKLGVGMKTLIIIVVGLPVLFYALLGLYFFVIPVVFHSAVIPSVTFHYKLTLVVDDNGKQSTGSSVVEVNREDTSKYFGNSLGGFGGKFKGEAVAVDLGEKGVLFALLKGDGSVDYPLFIFMKAFPSYFAESNNSASVSVIDDMRKLNNARPRPKAELPVDKIPMLVRFRDIADPKTVELVDPNDLEKTFGKGVKLVSATLEMTDDWWVTTGIMKKYLSWFDKWQEHGGTISGKAFFDSPPPPETILIPMNFIQE